MKCIYSNNHDVYEQVKQQNHMMIYKKYAENI